jgi:hypothetical protein
MQRTVKVFETTRDARPELRPTPAADVTVSGETLEDLRRAALARLAKDGREVRSLSFTVDGTLAAVVMPAAPSVPPPRAARRSKGGGA